LGTNKISTLGIKQQNKFLNIFNRLKQQRIAKERKDIQSAFLNKSINKKEKLFLTQKLNNISNFHFLTFSSEFRWAP